MYVVTYTIFKLALLLVAQKGNGKGQDNGSSDTNHPENDNHPKEDILGIPIPVEVAFLLFLGVIAMGIR